MSRARHRENHPATLGRRLQYCQRNKNGGEGYVHRATYCAHNYPLPLLPSGPGGVGGITSRRTRHRNHFTTVKLPSFSSCNMASTTPSLQSLLGSRMLRHLRLMAILAALVCSLPLAAQITMSFRSDGENV